MEGGINADQNFYSRRLHSPEHHDHHQRHYESPPLPEFEARSPQLPPKLPFLTTQNLQAVTGNSNGYAGGGLISGGDRNPDEFYREYRGVQQSANGYADIIPSGMAAAASESRPPPSSLRSNGNGTTPKHPPLPHARTALKPSYRSASSPLEDRPGLNNTKSTSALNGYPNSRQPSVKDLLKRFDQNNEQSDTSVRKPPPRIPTRDGNSGQIRDRVGNQARSTNASPVGSSRAGIATRDHTPGKTKSPPGRTTQRTRFATEDQYSNNTLSGAARTTRTRNGVSGFNPQASKSMSNLSPTSPTAPPQPQTRQPLFGEVLPIGQGTPNIGYGIPRAATRRTSDSSLHPSWTHNRSRSDLDISPSSPTAWYLGVTTELDDVDHTKPTRPTGHNRNHSDFADTRVNTMNGVSPSFQTSNSPRTSAVQPPSRLPVSSKRLSNSSDSSSLPSTRANSPFATKTLSNGKLRKPERPWSPAGRSMTPTNRAKTPTRSSPRGKSKSIDKSTSNNASLKAYISAPPPKTSPPLRSSRPRQPVSSATTASSRQKSSGSGSPQQVRTGMKLTRNNGEANEAKERKIPDLPLSKVDFVARRERIQRAYTKSIHESEQKEIRAANLRRLSERLQKAPIAVVENKEEPPHSVPEESSPTPEPEPEPVHIPAPPLQINTSFNTPEYGVKHHVPIDEDSPTLGMPGGYIEDEPPSAISNATEIENEPQTEAARLSRKPSGRSGLSSHVAYLEDQLSPEQAFFGMQNLGDEEESIHIMLDATPVEEQIPEPTPTKDIFARDPSPPGAFQDYDEEPPVFATTLTTASPSPKVVPANHSRPVTPLESGDEHGTNLDDNRESDENEIVESHVQAPSAPEIAFPDETDYPETPNSVDAPRLQLPLLRTALASRSVAGNDFGQDYLNTPVTDMDYESSDGLGSSRHENYDQAYDSSREAPMSAQYRSSHQSTWTDYSVGTGDEYSEREDFVAPTSEPERKPTPPPKELLVSPVVPPKPEGYSPLPSPRFAPSPAHLADLNRHQLPPLSTGDGLGLGFGEISPGFASSIAVPLWAPSYSPPPPPPPESGNASPAVPSRTPPLPGTHTRRPPSSLYQSSHNDNGRNPESRRASDDVYSDRPSLSTPRSSTQISFDETIDQSVKSKVQHEPTLTEEERQAAEKNRKRLYHRSMVIKELIDTESIYLKDMNVVEEIYKGTAEACPKLDSNDIKAIFRNTDEIVGFSTMFLDELKSAASSIYSPRSKRSRQSRTVQSGPSITASTNAISPTATEDRFSIAATLSDETDEEKDKKTFIGANFAKHLNKMQVIYTDFLKNSEVASTRLAALQQDGAVKVWLSECNLVAKDLTMAWDLDALLVKPVQRITRYQLLLKELNESTTPDHPDYDSLQTARQELSALLQNIDDLKKRIHMVGQIVGRKRKESDVRSGIAKAFGRRAEKIQANPNRPQEDEGYMKSKNKFGHDFLNLQIVLRDTENYIREQESYVQKTLQYFSSMELNMRLCASPYPEIESKWVRFNLSMRDMGTIAIEDHRSAIRKQVIEPLEKIIHLYNPPALAMKKRNKRRLDFERSLALKTQGKKIDDKLADLVAQYEALNETLKIELPKLSKLTTDMGNLCLLALVNLQKEWYGIWKKKLGAALEESQIPKDVQGILDMFNRDYKYSDAKIQELGIVSGSGTIRGSQSTMDDESYKKSRPSNLSGRSRGLSVNSDKSPSLPTPDFAKRLSGQFSFSPIVSNAPGLPQFAYQQMPYSNGHSRAGSGSPATPDTANSSRHHNNIGRPSTSRSHTSDTAMTRGSTDYNTQHRRESGSTYNSHYDGPPPSGRPYSGLFHSAMPMPDGPEDSQRSSRASSRDRNFSGGYNVLYLAASLFEFNISATKSEAGYPYLTYQAGEIFDVIGEKGELWLAKNQDDPSDQVGWIWSKHFAQLAAD